VLDIILEVSTYWTSKSKYIYFIYLFLSEYIMSGHLNAD